MRYRVLGNVQAWRNGRVATLGGPIPHTVLATLLLSANKIVSSDRLIGQVWGMSAPVTARAQLHTHISQLRKVLGTDVIARHGSGYQINVTSGQLDMNVFAELVAAARDARYAGDAPAVIAYLDRALALWTGPALGGTTDVLAGVERPALEEGRLAAMEDRIDAHLSLGVSTALVGELQALVRQHPLRERFHAQLMLALYRSGRRADALATFWQLRTRLVDEFGLDPSPELDALRAAILRTDPALSAPANPARISAHVTTFTGRSRRLARAGGPGATKTPLAVHLARHLSRDGRLYAVLRGCSPETAVPWSCWPGSYAPSV